MSKLITIFGATGQQGGSVIEAIEKDAQLSKEFTVRAITRNADSSSAQKLKDAGYEVVTADQNDPQTLKAAVQGSHTVFLVTSFFDSFSREKEAEQGKNVADACRDASVQHLIFSSLTDITTASKGKYTKVYHFDSKADIEQHIRGLGIPATFVLAGAYMQNFFDIIRKNEDGSSATLTLCAGDDIRFPLIDIVGDFGKFVKPVLKQPSKFLGKQIYAAERYYAPSEIVVTYTEVLGRPANFVTVPPEVFVTFAQPPPMAEDLTEMIQAFASPGYYAGAELDDKLALQEDELCDWKTFLERNKEKF